MSHVSLIEKYIRRICIAVAFAAGAIALPPAANAAPMHLAVQPIQVCDDSGLTCAAIPGSFPNIFTDATQQIWSQPGVDITVDFMPVSQLNSSQFLETDSTESSTLLNPLTAGTGRHANNQVLNLWLVDNLHGDTGGTTFGLALVGGNGVIINDQVFAANRLDTIAHEIGHNLGLDHASALGDNNNLMESGLSRNVPSVLGNITIDGVTGFDVLNAAQISTVLGSEFLTEFQIPEPAMVVIFAIGAVFTLRASKTSRVPAPAA